MLTLRALSILSLINLEIHVQFMSVGSDLNLKELSLVYGYTAHPIRSEPVKITRIRIVYDRELPYYFYSRISLKVWEEFMKLSLDLPDLEDILFLFNDAATMRIVQKEYMTAFRGARRTVRFRNQAVEEQGEFGGEETEENDDSTEDETEEDVSTEEETEEEGDSTEEEAEEEDFIQDW